MITPAEIARKNALPQPLRDLPEVFKVIVPKEPRSVCTLHGLMDGPNCDKCDEHFPDAVKARSVAAPVAAPQGFSEEQLKQYVADAVAQALAFERWKNSPEGKAAAAESVTSQATQEAKDAATGGSDVGGQQQGS